MMASDQGASNLGGPTLVSPAKRRQLQVCFETGKRALTREDPEYALQMFTQCVIGDPTCYEYAKAFLENLHAKFGHDKKNVGSLAGWKGAGHKSAMRKAKGKGDWLSVAKAGADMLQLNPWDAPTLVAMSEACEHLESDECQLYYLKMALGTSPKDAELNRISALALGRLGLFDQAITCWHRVEEAKPDDDEALKMIGELTLQRTMPRTEHDKQKAAATQEFFRRKQLVEKAGESRAKLAAENLAAAEQEDASPAEAHAKPRRELTEEERLLAAIEANPSETSNYVDLANHYSSEDQLDKAEAMLAKALDASGGGDLRIRERLENLQILRSHRQWQIAKQRAASEQSEEAEKLAKRMKTALNRTELDVFASRAERKPNDRKLRFELGVRLKRAGKFKEAIEALQKAKDEDNPRPAVYLELGECLQYAKQYDPAMDHYDQAIARADEDELATKKLALYRAGVLAAGLKQPEIAQKHLSELAEIDPDYRDTQERLDKLAETRQDDGSA